MSDPWNPDWEYEMPKQETESDEPKPSEESTAAEAEPAPAPESTPTPEQPEPVPYNGWNSDGSYRYVPPREPQPPAPPEPPTPTPEQPEPVPYNGWNTDGSYRYVPPREPQPPASPEASERPSAAPGYSGYPTGQPSYYSPAPQPPRRKKNGSGGWIAAIAVIASLALIVSIVFLGLGYFYSNDEEKTDSPETSSSSKEEPKGEGENAPQLSINDWDDNDGGLSTREVVNRNLDSTVVLTMYVRTASYSFGSSNETEAGAASGIVMSKDGYIITNRHCVIDETTGEVYDRIDVTTYNGKVYENARVVGADETTDLAVVKVNAKKLTVAQFGDSSALHVGDRVIALGNAAGLSWTATQGIVSALARDVYEDTGYSIKCLQTDAAINPGNSGGPLLNNQGMVVGINSSKIAATNYEGLGFAIPINEAKTIIDSLVKYGYVKGRVALGIRGKTISSGEYKGFLITSISEWSNLNSTKVAVGDLIVGVDGETIVDYGELRTALSKHKIGDTVTISLLHSDRSGRVSAYDVRVILQEQKADQ